MPQHRLPIRVAIAGIGNCASSLVQGVSWYARTKTAAGLITPRVGPYGADSIEFVAAFDVDARKVGRRLDEAIFAEPNNAIRIEPDVHCAPSVEVQMGPVHDSIAAHMTQYEARRTFVLASCPPVDVVEQLRRAAADFLICYLPVGSTRAVEFYAEAALAAGVGFINCVPVFIASNPAFAARFAQARILLIGDDIRSQVGATIVHQRLVELLSERGYGIESSYQLNVGGNTDFLNMLARDRLMQKKMSKTNAVRNKIQAEIAPDKLHIGPSDYVPHLGDTKIAYIRAEATGFGGAPLSMEVRLQVEDSPNSAAVVLDAVRYAALARAMGQFGTIDPICSYYMKSPPRHLSDSDALQRLGEMAVGEEPARNVRATPS